MSSYLTTLFTRQLFHSAVGILTAIGFSARRIRMSRGHVHGVHNRWRTRMQRCRKFKCAEYILLFVLLSIPFTKTFAADAPTPWFNINSQMSQSTVQLRVDLFLSSSCPHCIATDKFFHQLQAQNSWLEVHRWYVNKNKQALDRLEALTDAQQITVNQFAVPAIFFCDARWLGFDDKPSTKKLILKSLTYCRDQIAQTGALSDNTVKVVRQEAISDWYKSSIVPKTSLFSLALTLAALDALSVCSLLSVLVMFACLFLVPRLWVRYGVAVVFLLSVGLLHDLVQTHHLEFYQIVARLSWTVRFIGVLSFAAIYFCREEKVYLRTDSMGLNGALVVLATLAVALVYSTQQGCTPNFSLVFQEYLAAEHLSPQVWLFHRVLYQLIYCAVLGFALLVLFFIASRLKNYDSILRKMVWIVLVIAAGELILYSL